MKRKSRTLFFTMLALLLPVAASAQMLKGKIDDPALREGARLIYNPDKGGTDFDGYVIRLQPDDKGDFSFTTDKITEQPFCMASVRLKDGSEYRFFLQPGSTLEMEIGRSGRVVYKGGHAAESKVLDLYGRSYKFEKFFSYEDQDDTIPVARKQAMLEASHREVSKAVSELKESGMKSFLRQMNDDCYLRYSLRMLSDKDPEYSGLCNRIDVNNWIGLLNYLPQVFIDHKLGHQYDNLFGHDLTDYGLAYLDTIKKYVTDPTVKHALMRECAKVTLNYGKDYTDIDRFWNPFKVYCGSDSSLIKAYQFKVNALKNTKKGRKAPDFTFEDVQGRTHRLSDYFGKVLYIDCWATWCGPCCHEIPYLATLAEHFKDNKQLLFLSVSLDQNRKVWIAKIAKDRPQWDQFRVNAQEHEVLSKEYGITAIPRFLIINADGTVYDSDALRPSDKGLPEVLERLTAGK